MTRSHLTLLALALLTPLAHAQRIEDPANLLGERVQPQSPADTLPLNHGAPALQQLLLKLRTRASLLMIVAHPDDEDGGLLTYESRGQGARVGMLTLTRGEGGQNLMTADFNDALGLIRTQELLAADRYLGVDQMFGTEVDFGFSKTKEESLQQWTHQRVLYDAVRAVRLYRPLVLASVFVGGVTDGHGHHQVAGEITQEVFQAAADPSIFPEMNLPPWAPLAVYARVPFSRVTREGMYDYATGKTVPPFFHNYITGVDTTTPPEATVTIHEGDPATIAGQPALGMENKSYVQFARQGLALQKTQIGQGVRLAPAGEFNVGYTLMATRSAFGCPSLSAAPSPMGVAAVANATGRLPELTANAGHPERSIEPSRCGVEGPRDTQPRLNLQDLSAADSGCPAVTATLKLASFQPLGTPGLQARVSQSPTDKAASAPGVCLPAGSAHSPTWASTALKPQSQPDLFHNIDTTLPSMASLAPAASDNVKLVLKTNLAYMDQQLSQAQAAFNPEHLEKTVPALRNAFQSLNSLVANIETMQPQLLPAEQKFNLLHELRIKRVQLNNALVLALNLTLEPMSQSEHASYADLHTTIDPSFYSNARLTNGGPDQVELLHLNPVNDTEAPSAAHTNLPPSANTFAEARMHYTTPPQATRPYFTRNTSEQPFYDVADPALRLAPATPAPFVASALVNDQGVDLELRAIVPDADSVLRRRAPAVNLRYMPAAVPQPAVVIPPVSIDLRRTSVISASEPAQNFLQAADTQAANSAGIIALDTPQIGLGASLGVYVFEPSILGPARIGPGNIPVTLTAPSAWKVSAPTFKTNREPILEHFTLDPAQLHPDQTYVIHAIATFKDKPYSESFRLVGYPGLTYTNFYIPATYKATAIAVTTAPNLKVAYLSGTGDDVPDYLPNLGITPTRLTPADLTTKDLTHFDAILLGVRAYNAHPDLAGPASAALLAYAQQGGVVIAQYNTGNLPPDATPYPLQIPGDPAHNVVVEADPVQILIPESPILNYPNRITAEDFEHWTEERGHGFPDTWDSHFQALLETHDPGQDPQRGGLLVAHTGRGLYVYVALALYRQLPEGVPGAYRLLANLLSQSKARAVGSP